MQKDSSRWKFQRRPMAVNFPYLRLKPVVCCSAFAVPPAPTFQNNRPLLLQQIMLARILSF